MWCLISQPNSVVIEVRVDPKAIGQECLEKVCEHLNISKECDYFGLKYESSKGEELWLNLRNPIDRQIGVHGHNTSVRFALRVKFWVPPHLLLQESTRHQFYLHARLDLCEKKLIVPDSDIAVRLVALIAQAEFGNYSHQHHPQNIYAVLRTIIPRDASVSHQDLLWKLVAEHKNCADMKPCTAEYWFLKEVATLETFGEEMFQLKPSNATVQWQKVDNVRLGVGPHGVTKYDDRGGSEKLLIPFTAIQSASSHRRTFKLEYVNMDNVLAHFEVKLESSHAANGLYRAITEKHAFYSCETVRSAVTEQFIRDLKGTIVSIFNEDSSLGKKYVFDIRRTCREVYDNARRALYQESQVPNQMQEEDVGNLDGKHCSDSHERLTRILDAMTCKICMDNQINTAFFPCAHIVACSLCASKCDRCPLCRADIKQSEKVYLPTDLQQ
ncbi:E3 ubiquitin-protein ligase MYLIP-A [Onthophagus taurus]|uniref:E3 ubiquitin-protein ligase MYLIP-A n=1 Tax=Onthophagus taurus TaxID=166361 RepID=UPI000C2009E9|nr:E3 ubiquitin-protein ligase MYLIP-A [Onthophagus taurus]